MTTTTNYGYTVITGTDSPVNIQNDIAPNFTAIDTDLKAVSDAAITVATHTVAGTVHQLVRTDADRNVMYFVATGDMVAGDTFTVDGVTVTARLVNGETLATGSFKINNNVFGILVGTVLNLLVPGANATASQTSYDNTVSGLAATNVQDAIDENTSAINANTAAIGAIVPGSKLSVLYTNPTPSVGMGEGTTITLSSADYDALIATFNVDLNDTKYKSFIVLKGETIFCDVVRTSGLNYVTATNRNIEYVNDLTYTVHDASEQASNSAAFTTPNRFVPIKIIGIKF